MLAVLTAVTSCWQLHQLVMSTICTQFSQLSHAALIAEISCQQFSLLTTRFDNIYKLKYKRSPPVLFSPWTKQQIYIYRVSFFDWSTLKMTQTQTLWKLWYLELFWLDLLCNLTFSHFLGRTSQKITLYINFDKRTERFLREAFKRVLADFAR